MGSNPKKVVLISLTGLYSGNPFQFPLGIGYLVSMLQQDRPVHAVHYHDSGTAQRQLPELIIQYTPDIIGLTCTTFNRGAVRQVCAWLRASWPEICIVLGGVHASFQFEQALLEYGADYVVIGEGEYTFRELCNALDKDTSLLDVRGVALLDQTGKVVTTAPREVVQNLDNLPIPDHSFVREHMQKFGMGFIITSRGCPVRCSFCSTSSYWGQRVRTNSPQRVVDEMELLVNTFGVHKIFFYDDTFNLGIGRVRAICNEIMGRELLVEWGASCRVSPVSQEMIDLMVAAGCRHICWGIETGSPEMLARIGKKITLEQIHQAFELCRSHMESGMLSVGAFIMVGNPGESRKTIAETIALLNSLPMTDRPSTSTLYILPGTSLANDLQAEVPLLSTFWAQSDDIPFYTLEHSMETLQKWSLMISECGNTIAFDPKRHFWKNVLISTTDETPDGEIVTQQSELDRLISPEIKNDELYTAIMRLAAETPARHILEIGSSSGGGSTEAFARGISQNPAAPMLHCMEVSIPRFQALQERYTNQPKVNCLHASSVGLDQFPSENEVTLFYQNTPTALNDYPLERILGWLRQDIEYIQHSGAPENGIQLIRERYNIDCFDMVLIDGSEFLGRAEFEEIYGANIILLDDINGFKNYHNRQRLLADPHYQLLHENLQLRNGYAIFIKATAKPLPIHFFTIVLNGEPFIRHHIDIFKQLPFDWHWHIVEGVADLVHDTAWSVRNGGQISDELHSNGLSNDGTSQYLDELAIRFPNLISLYRKPSGQFWNGKLEMVNAPLVNIKEECLLWQVDSDELWDGESIERLRNLFIQQPGKTAAYCYCDYFVGPYKYISSLNTWATRPYEWLRAWRFLPGMRWSAHEPPILANSSGNNVADLAPFTREETVAAGVTFQHYAYVVKSQVRFKEIYYGYRDAVTCWLRLQQTCGPVKAINYLPWVPEGAIVDNWPADAAPHLAKRLLVPEITQHKKAKLLLIYSIHPVFGAVTLPEWIKSTLRTHYSSEVEVLACGPGNEIPINDSQHFYADVASLVRTQSVDIIWDIEGGATSTDFMFRRYPTGINIPKVFWAIDTHQYLSEQTHKAQYFDLVFSAQYNATKALGPHAIWLPAGAALHEIDYNVKRDIDVGFIGNLFPGLHNRRIRIIEQLQKEFPEFIWINNVFLEEKAHMASRMKIMINVSLNNDINFRVFETLACGALLLTDKIHENGFELLFEDGKHLITYTTTEDLIGKIYYYLENEEERLRIAQAGQLHVLQNYTHTHIIRKALDYMKPLLNHNGQESQNIQTSPASCWCGGTLRSSVHDDYLVCDSCGTHVSKNTCEPKTLLDFYSLENYWREYQREVGGYPPIEVRATNDFCDRIPVWHQILSLIKKHPKRLLEIGCSHGGFLKYCQDNGIETVVGVEVDEKTCAFARKSFELPHVSNGLFPDVSLPFSSFDAIVGFDVIEHFMDPNRSIRAIADLLTDDGVFLFQTPCYRGESSEWQQFKPGEHLFLFNQRSINQLFLLNGLTITEILPGFFADDMFVAGIKQPDIKQIIYLRTDAIGDNVLSAGMLPHLKKRYPGALLTIVCQDRVAPLYDSCPYVDGVISFNYIHFMTQPTYRQLILNKINCLQPTLLLNPIFSHDLHDEFLAHHCTAPLKIAYQGDASNRNQDKIDDLQHLYSLVVPNNPENLTERDRNSTFLQVIGITAPALEPQVWYSQDDEAWAESLLAQQNIAYREAIVLFPGALLDCKTYPRYAEVVQQLQGHPLIILGGEELQQTGDELCLAHAGKAVNLAGKTSLGQMAALMKAARLYLGSDSAGMHIACAVGLKNVVLLGGGHFGRFCPYSPLTTAVCLPLVCYQCNWQCRHEQVHCLHDILPETVLQAITHSLHDTGDRQEPVIFPQQNLTADLDSSSMQRLLKGRFKIAGKANYVTDR